jgi:hypothetical protein
VRWERYPLRWARQGVIQVGAAGHLHDIRTPLVIPVACYVAAALYARRAFAG